jgi:hypothetical protein
MPPEFPEPITYPVPIFSFPENGLNGRGVSCMAKTNSDKQLPARLWSRRCRTPYAINSNSIRKQMAAADEYHYVKQLLQMLTAGIGTLRRSRCGPSFRQ